jgi:tetratricopeptide (TPR) repeat protein
MAMLLHSVVDFNMHIPSNAILAVTLMALVSGYFRFSSEGYWHTVRWPLRIPVMIILLAGLAYLGMQSWQATAESYWLKRAAGTTASADEQITAFEKAFAVDGKNAATAYNIGECFRLQSWEGAEGYEALAEKAMQWFQQSASLNRYDPNNYLRCGMCLDWLGRHEQAYTFFQKAQAIDPNSYYVQAMLGWHYVQLEDWATARDWFLKSLSLMGPRNVMALSYLRIVERKMAAPRTAQLGR